MSRISGIGNGFPTVCSAARSDITHKPLDALSVASFSSLFPILSPFCVLCLSWFVRGGVLAFQDLSFVPFLLFSAHLPLWSAAFVKSTRPSNAQGPTQRERDGSHYTGSSKLHRIFQEAGLPPFSVRLLLGFGDKLARTKTAITHTSQY